MHQGILDFKRVFKKNKLQRCEKKCPPSIARIFNITFPREFDGSIVLSKKALSRACRIAARTGYTEVVEAIIHSARFNDVSVRKCQGLVIPARIGPSFNTVHTLDNAFIDAAGRGHTEIITAILNSTRFAHIAKASLHEALELAKENNRADIILMILGSNRSAEITEYCLPSLLQFATDKNHIDLFSTIINLPQFQGIWTSHLDGILQHAAYLGCTDIVIQLIKCNKFNDFTPYSLGWSLDRAAYKNFVDIAISILNSGRINDISIEWINYAFSNAAIRGHTDVVIAIINSTRINDIAVATLKDSFDRACTGGYTAVITAIINSDLFPNLAIGDLEYGLHDSIRRRYLATTVAILSRALANISETSLADTLIFAAVYGYSEVVDIILSSFRLSEIPKHSLNYAKTCALGNGHPEIANKFSFAITSACVIL